MRRCHRTRMLTALVLFSQIAVPLSATEPKDAARKPFVLPGLVVDFEKQCIDLDASICLDQGYLELVACSKGSKEHESIVAVAARPMHIHTALLLLGANNGHPVMRKRAEGEHDRWITVPPRGDRIEVSLVITGSDRGPNERSISDFVVYSTQRLDEVDGTVIAAPPQASATAQQSAAAQKNATGKEATPQFPDAFVFAGSHLQDNGAAPRRYLADVSGNVISIATFGDELLCLPTPETQKNSSLSWRIKAGTLPKVGTRVTLRLRPARSTSPLTTTPLNTDSPHEDRSLPGIASPGRKASRTKP